MWLPLILLALMASGSACPDLCECHQSVIERDQLGLVDVKCRGRAPELVEIPIQTSCLLIDGAEEYEVIGLLEELETTDASDDFDVIGTLNVLGANDTFDLSTGNSLTLPYITELTLTNCSLVSLNVSWHGLERMRALNLSRNNLARLSDLLIGRMLNLSELARLDLSNNCLTVVSAEAFRTLLTLVRLILRNNAISVVHEDAFRGLDRLEFLDLSDNRLADLPDSALTPLYSLQKLDLSGNQLQVLGARWFESLDRLRELDVSRNGLARAASGTLQPLSGLSVLKLSENPLKERDVSLLLGTGRRLETVDASRTGLARVPAALTRSVRALRLAGNKLTTIRGGDLDSYPLLRILDISDNRLTDIEDDALGRLEVLEELDISGNSLPKIPGSLPSSLTVLKLQRNAISALRSDDLQGLFTLKTLILNDNSISEIEVGSLSQLPLLVELDLSDNPVKTLPANTLSGPSNLAKLRMSGLTSLKRKQEEQSDMTFPVPTPERLIILDVSRSPVLARQLLADDATLSACKSLAELNLSETNITSLRFDLSYMLPQLRTLSLSGNDWNCTEDLYWLGEWIRQHEELNKEIQAGQCASPQELSGSFLYELPSPPSPLPTTLPTATPTASLTSTIVTTTQNFSITAQSNVSSSIDSITTFAVTNDTSDRTPLPGTTTTNLLQEDTEIETTLGSTSSKLETDGNSSKSDASLSLITNNPTRFYEAPTSFKNVTTLLSAGKSRDFRKKTSKVDRIVLDKNSIKKILSSGSQRGKKMPIIGDEDRADLGNLDNQADAGRLGKARTSSGMINSPMAPEVESQREQLKEKRTEKYSKGLSNLTKENFVLRSPLDSNTIAEELNGRASDSGAHPGMLVLAGAALGAVAALTVVLSRRATVRRRERYHRHENIEVHTLTPTTELW